MPEEKPPLAPVGCVLLILFACLPVASFLWRAAVKIVEWVNS